MIAAQRKKRSLKWVSLVGAALLAQPGLAGAAPRAAANIHLTRAQEKSLNIQTAEIKAAAIRPMITLYGELRANPRARWILASPLAGVVVHLHGKAWPQIGTHVVRGSSLAGIKPVVSTTLNITLALELTKVKADLLAARVAQSAAAAAYHREQSLYARNKAVSLQRVQAAHAAFAGAAARVQADFQSIAAISRQLKTRTGGFLPLPIFQSGMVTAILAHPGEAVAADQPLLKIEDFHTLLAAVALPASDSGRIAAGTIAHVRALGHRHWLKAQPLTLGPQADRQTRGLTMLYVMDNPGTLRPGMAITAWIPKTAKAVTMTIVPRSAVIWWEGERWVFAARGKGVFTMRELIHPLSVPAGYAVKNGSLPEKRIVSRGAQLLLTIKLSSTLKKSG